MPCIKGHFLGDLPRVGEPLWVGEDYFKSRENSSLRTKLEAGGRIAFNEFA